MIFIISNFHEFNECVLTFSCLHQFFMRLSNELLIDSLQVSKLILPGNLYLGPFEKSLRRTKSEIILRSPVII